MPADSGDPNVTNLLVEWRRGDDAALARLIPIVYGELRAWRARLLQRLSSPARGAEDR